MNERIEHRLCLRHLYANFKKRFGGGSLIRDLMMGAAKASYYQGWLSKMNELKQLDQKAWSWLMGVPPKSWCKHAFSFYSKCDVLMNNIAESFNATILAARDKSILSMAEWIRKYLMSRCSTSSLKLEKWPHKVMPIPIKRLDNEVVLSGQWLPTWAMNEKFQVTHSFNTQEFIVDIAQKSCTCNFWELVGIPCRHAVAALGFRQQNPEDYVDECYSRDKYKICYGFAVSPINGQDMWPEVESEVLLPPMYKKGPGRPRKLRIRESGEEGSRKRLPSVSYRCSKCDKFGHNSQSCKSKTQDPNGLKRKKKQRPEVTPDEEGASQQPTGPCDAASQLPTGPADVDSEVPVVPTQASQVPTQASQAFQVPTQASQPTDYYGDITDELLSSLPDIGTSQANTAESKHGKIQKRRGNV